MGPFTLFASPMLLSLVATIEKPQFEGRTRIIARHLFSISLTFSCRQLLVGAPPSRLAVARCILGLTDPSIAVPVAPSLTPAFSQAPKHRIR